jgi:hypothetical protein
MKNPLNIKIVFLGATILSLIVVGLFGTNFLKNNPVVV